MTKKFCFWCPVPLPWLFFASSLLPSRGFTQSTAIRCWEVGYRFPVYDEQGRVDTSITVSKHLYVESDLMMYAYSYGYATGVDGQQLTSGTGCKYFIYEKDSLSGIQYDDQHPEFTRSFGVDSLKRLMVPYLKQFDLFKKGVGRLVSAVSHAGSGQLEETYCDINWTKHPNHDSCYVSYSDRLNFLPREMSLDVTLDSLYQKKLCRFKMVIHPAPDQQAHRTYDRSEWIWKLEEVSDFNRDTIQAYFSRYRHDVGVIHP
jgi:hypothetical protein